MIEAFLKTSDEKYFIKFDITPWLTEAVAPQFDQLIKNPFDSLITLDIAKFCSTQNSEVREVLEYGESDRVDIEVVVKIEDVQRWLKEHRPEVYEMVNVRKHFI